MISLRSACRNRASGDGSNTRWKVDWLENAAGIKARMATIAHLRSAKCRSCVSLSADHPRCGPGAVPVSCSAGRRAVALGVRGSAARRWSVRRVNRRAAGSGQTHPGPPRLSQRGSFRLDRLIVGATLASRSRGMSGSDAIGSGICLWALLWASTARWSTSIARLSSSLPLPLSDAVAVQRLRMVIPRRVRTLELAAGQIMGGARSLVLSGATAKGALSLYFAP